MAGRWKELLVWQRSHEIVLDIYKLTKGFPKLETYSLIDQIKRAAYSVPANIVEGHSKKSKKEFIRYLYISRGSLEELRYFLLLSKDLNYISKEEYDNFEEKLTEISYLLNQLIKSLTSTPSTPSTTSTTSKASTKSKTLRKET
ncbi:four helix bundle protein [Desulfurobacterium thermolithotrophum]|uniref:four helix bundle protein n=1 Tax=Desulfurobacterium thermolithotrophum TaxID=64160 RepID=UPI0013D12E52|nr:four helix bundle protein [Desulfurobacterium thermolithotrophum]